MAKQLSFTNEKGGCEQQPPENVNNEQKRASFKYGNLKYLIIAGFIPYANDYYITKLFRSTFAGDMVEEHERTTADLGDSVLTKCAKISLKA